MLIHRFICAVALAAALALAPLAARAAVEQVNDINPGPGQIRGSMDNSEFAMAKNGEFYFTAETVSEDTELWATDGAAAHTWRLTNAPGDLYTHVYGGAFLGDELYFVADTETGVGLWKTDGTKSGTQIVRNWNQMSAPTSVVGLTAVDGTLYFGILVHGGDYAVWTSDGTDAGTRKIKDIGPGGGHDEEDYRFAPVGASGNVRVLFTAGDGNNGTDLWVMNDDGANVHKLRTFTTAGELASFVPLSNGDTVFTKGDQLWVTDGGSQTKRVDITDGTTTSSYPRNLTVIDDWVYFAANGGDRGLWRTNGTTVTLVQAGQIVPWSLTAAGSALYFIDSTQTTLFEYDGSPVTTAYSLPASEGYITALAYSGGHLYFRLSGGTRINGLYLYNSKDDANLLEPIDFNRHYLVAYADKLFLAAADGSHGVEPWVSDGTVAGTHMIKNIAGPDSSSNPDRLTIAGDKMVFAAYDPTHGREPWVSDGASAGTTLAGNVAPGSDDGDPRQFTVFGDAVYFAADTGSADLLVKIAGDCLGAKVVAPTAGYDDPYDPVVFDDELYFLAYGLDDDRYELWKSDGTDAGTAVAVGAIDPYAFATAGGRLFLIGQDSGGTDMQLWASDGTAGGTTKLTSGLDIDPYRHVAVDGALYFVSDDGDGPGLWVSDGTDAGTHKLAGQMEAYLHSSIVVGGGLYFVASDPDHGNEIWVTDGTVAGTRPIDIVPGPDSSEPHGLTAYNSRLYFAYGTDKNGWELWRTDGTAGGTELVADLNPGPPSSDPSGLTVAGGRLYFSAYTPGGGYEPWVTEGGEPVQVKDIRPGGKGSYPQVLAAIGNRVVFNAIDGVHGNEPWISDGTPAGTTMVGDVNPDAGSSNPREYVLFKRRLFFAANDGTGVELWRADINRRPVAGGASVTTAFETAYSGKLTAGDPDGDAVTFSVKQPEHGKVKLTDKSTGAFTYTPADGYSGDDSFTFKADDGLATSVATVNVIVKSERAGDNGNGGDDDSGGVDDTTMPPTTTLDGSGGGGSWGLLGWLAMLPALFRRRPQRDSGVAANARLPRR